MTTCRHCHRPIVWDTQWITADDGDGWCEGSTATDGHRPR